MSASSKKKLRNEQEAAKMTERQLTEQKEAKKLKLYTAIFTVVLAAIVVIALWTGITQSIVNSGIREKNTVALTVGDEALSNAELNYYFIDAVNEFYSYYGTYAAMFGLDVTAPLNEQVSNEETGDTWADDFENSAISSAQANIALAKEAEANGFTLTEEQITEIDANIASLETYALLSGFSKGEDYLKAMFGQGATIESYREYCETATLANSYYAHYAQDLSYGDADIRAKEAENYDQYSSYSYNYYYMPTSRFLTGGTTNEAGTTTYTDEEKAASVIAAEAAAKSLVGEDITSVDALNEAIAALRINAESETTASSTANTDVLYGSVLSVAKDWITASERKAGDVTYIPSESTVMDADGNETTTVNGYYVVYFVGKNDNTFALANVRHILVGFEGGTYDSNTGLTTYTDEEKAAAKEKAEALLAEFNAGTADEDSFAALANEHSADGDGTTGGLYENVYPGQMVTNFNDWCFDESRKPGDTGIVESEYGYHVMFYSGDSETTYRDHMIEEDLRSADATAWYNALIEAAPITEGDTKYLSKDLVLSRG